MVNKNQMLTLMLSAAAIMLTSGKEVAATINTEAIVTQFNQTLTDLQPKAKNFVNMVQKGNFDGIASTLAIDLTPAVQFLVDESSNIDENFKKYLSYLEDLITQVPDKYKDAANAALKEIQNNMAHLDTLKPYLQDIEKYADLSQYKDIIASALEKASQSAEFKTVKDNLKNSKLTTFLNQATISKSDIETVKNSLNKISELAQSSEITLNDVQKIIAPGVKILRTKILPFAPAIAAELSATALEINNLIKENKYQLPSEAITALDNINKFGIEIYDAFKNTINPNIEKIKSYLKK